MPGICSCITAHITVPINCRYHCSSITRAITELRPETTASAPHFGTMYSGRCCADDLGACRKPYPTWQSIENRTMIVCNEGSLQAHWLDGCGSDPVAGNA